MQKPATVEALTPAGPPRQLALCGPDAEEEDGEPGQEDDDGVQAYSGHHELEHEDGLAHDVDDGLEDEDAALDGHGGEISEPGESHSEDELPPISQRPAQRQQALLDDGTDDDLDMENLAPPRALQRPAQRAVAATPPAQRRGAGVSHDIMPPCMKKRVLGGSAAARRQQAGSKQRASNAAVASKTPLQGGGKCVCTPTARARAEGRNAHVQRVAGSASSPLALPRSRPSARGPTFRCLQLSEGTAVWACGCQCVESAVESAHVPHCTRAWPTVQLQARVHVTRTVYGCTGLDSMWRGCRARMGYMLLFILVEDAAYASCCR